MNTIAIRDPIHKYIKFSNAEKNLIDSKLFQRLRWVSQLGSVAMVYPGGTNTRLLHSIGTMHVAGEYMTNIINNSITLFNQNNEECKELVHELITNKEYFIQLARIAGLLHDIGHGPFSHAFDKAIYFKMYNVADGGHDYHRIKIVNDPEMYKLILACCVLPNDIIKVWNSKISNDTPGSGRTDDKLASIYLMIGAIIQGPIGSDRIDFTQHDSYFTGTAHFGTISADRIISNAVFFNGKLNYNVKCLSDIIQALDGRCFMYENVYQHKVVQSATILIEQMMELSSKHLRLVERTENLNEFVLLNDSTIIGEIISYNGIDTDMNLAKIYCQRLLFRELPKLESEHQVNDNIIVDNDFEFDKKEDNNIKTIKTKSLSGINHKKFDDYDIMFLTKKHESVTCQNALDSINYKQHQSEHSLIRKYRLL